VLGIGVLDAAQLGCPDEVPVHEQPLVPGIVVDQVVQDRLSLLADQLRVRGQQCFLVL